MSSSSQFVLQSKESEAFKKRLTLTAQAVSVSIPAETGGYQKIQLKLDNGRPSWSKDGSKYVLSFGKCPVNIEKVVYPKITLPALSANIKKRETTGAHYFLIDQKNNRIISSKIFKKERTFTKKQSFKEFGIAFDKKIHRLEIRPVLDGVSIGLEQDAFGNDYLEVIQDKRIKMFLGALLSLWLLSTGFHMIKDYFKTEVTKIQIENKDKILKERIEIAALLNKVASVEIVTTPTRDNKPLKSKGVVKRKSKKKKAYSVKKTTKKRLKKGKNTVAATRKAIAKPKSKPSLQDQLFSRSLKKGSVGRASNNASKTLRGSSKGTSAGKGYAGAGTIKGGFVKGTGSSFGTKLGNRGGSGGGNYATGGTGVGGLGAGLSLNGSGAGVSGGLTREQINKVVRLNKKDISRCFATREQFSPGLSGNVSMRFTINSLGNVVSSAAGASSIKDAALKNCLSRKISGWKFDKPTGGRTVKVSYPFNFKSTQGKF